MARGVHELAALPVRDQDGQQGVFAILTEGYCRDSFFLVPALRAGAEAKNYGEDRPSFWPRPDIRSRSSKPKSTRLTHAFSDCSPGGAGFGICTRFACPPG